MMNKQHRGFTLLELMVVIALIGIIAGLAGPYFVDYLRMQRLRGVAGELATDLAFARSEAVSRGNFVQLRVQNTITMSCYIIAVRTTPDDAGYMCDCTQPPASRCIEAGTTELKTVQMPDSMLVSFTAVAPPGQSVPTNALTINPRSGGVWFPKASEDWRRESFIIDTQLDSSRRIRSMMEALGKVTTCVPSGSVVTGMPAC